MSTAIEIRQIARQFGSHAVLDGINLSIRPGEPLALLGPSGSGKTTLLRLIAGLDQPDAGSITIDRDDATKRQPKERGVGFVFQHYALFRHMNVFENIAFALRVRKASKAEVTARVTELLKLIQLESLSARYPAQLSGGQRQRVALARALASQPRVLLLDEPFGALDAVVRRDLRRWLRQLHTQMNITTLFVTHDQEEAFDLADRVVIMNAGKICQQGTPIEIYQSPATAFVHEFLGESNRIPVTIKNNSVSADAGFVLGSAEGAAGSMLGLIRPHHITLHPHAQGAWRITRIAATGAQARLTLSGFGMTLESAMAADTLLQIQLHEGQPVNITITSGMLFDTAGDNPIKLQPAQPPQARDSVKVLSVDSFVS